MSRSFLKNLNIWLGGLFVVIGIPCLLLSTRLGLESQTLVQQGLKTDGVVMELIQKWSSSSKSSSGRSYAPLFRFQTPDGKEHIVQSSTSSNPPAYDVGDHVPVLYLAGKPEQAVINSFMELWIAPLITGIIGIAFFVVGLVLVIAFFRKRQLDVWLVQHGQRIQAGVQGVEVNTSIKVNRRSPFQIICTWKDPASQKTYTFKSENFWEDPTTLIQGKKSIDVLIKPEDPTKYLMDTAFCGI